MQKDLIQMRQQTRSQSVNNESSEVFGANIKHQKQSMSSHYLAEQTCHQSLSKTNQIQQIKIETVGIGSQQIEDHQHLIKSEENIEDQVNSKGINCTYDQQQSIKKSNKQQSAKNKITLKQCQKFQQIQICRFKFDIGSNLIFLREIGLHFYHQVVINQTIQCNYTHFHILFVLNNLEVMSHYRNLSSSEMEIYNKYCIKKLLLPSMKAQLSEMALYKVLSFILKARNAFPEAIAIFMREFILEYKQVVISICPYYYNIFALNINKSIIFEQNEPKIDQLIDYSVEYKHTKFYRGNFSRQDILQVIVDLQSKIKQKYNSQEL